MRATALQAEVPPVASRASMSEYQNTPSPRRLTTRKSPRTGAIRTAPLKRMYSAESHRRRRSIPDSSLDMDGLVSDQLELRAMGSRNSAQHALQIVGGPTPRYRLGGAPRFPAQASAQRRIARELSGHLTEGRGVVVGREQRARSVAQVLSRRGVVVREHREPARHGFESDVAESLGDARKEKDVRRSVVLGEVPAGAHPGEHEIGVLSAQHSGLRPISDED